MPSGKKASGRIGRGRPSLQLRIDVWDWLKENGSKYQKRDLVYEKCSDIFGVGAASVKEWHSRPRPSPKGKKRKRKSTKSAKKEERKSVRNKKQKPAKSQEKGNSKKVTSKKEKKKSPKKGVSRPAPVGNDTENVRTNGVQKSAAVPCKQSPTAPLTNGFTNHAEAPAAGKNSEKSENNSPTKGVKRKADSPKSVQVDKNNSPTKGVKRKADSPKNVQLDKNNSPAKGVKRKAESPKSGQVDKSNSPGKGAKRKTDSPKSAHVEKKQKTSGEVCVKIEKPAEPEAVESPRKSIPEQSKSPPKSPMDVDSSSVCSSQSSSSQSAMSFESDLVAVKCHSCCSMVDVSKLDPIQLTQSQKKRHDAKKKAKNSPSVGSLKINSHHTSDADVFRFMVKQYCEGEKVKWSTVKEHCHVGYKRANLMVAEFLKNPKHYVETYGDGKVKCPSGDEVKIVETLQKKLEDLRKEHDALKVQKDECEEKMAIDLKQHSERVEQLQKQNSETVAKMETKVEAVHRQMSKMECDTSVQLKSKVESEVRSLRFVARQLEKENRDIHAQVWMVNTYDPYTNSELHRIQTEIRKLNSELEEVATNRDDLNKQLEFPAPNSQFEFAELHRKSSRQQVQLQQMAELCHKQQRQMAAMQRQTAAACKLDQAAGGKANQAAGGKGQATGDNLNLSGDSGSMGARSDQDARQMLKSRKNIQLVQQGIHMAAQHSDGKIDRNSLAKAQNSFILAQNNQQIPPNNIQMIHNMVQNVTLSHLGQPNANFPQNHPNLMANTAQMTQRFAANSSRLPLRQEPGNLRQEPGNLHQARENLFNSNSYRPGQRLYGRSSGGAGLQSGPFPTRHPLMANGQPQPVNPAPRLPAYATRNGTSLENVIQMFQNLLGKDKLEIVAALTYVGHTSDFGSYVSRHVAKHSLFRIRTVFASPTDHSSLAHSTPRHWLNFARPIVRDVLMAVTTQILSSNPSIPQLFPSKPKTEGDSGVGQGSGASQGSGVEQGSGVDQVSGASQGSGAGDQVSSVTANLSIDQSSSSNQTCANETTGVNHSSSSVSSSTQSSVVNHDPSTNSMPSAKQTSGASQISGADQASNSNQTSGASQMSDINLTS
eukprot:331494_1